MSRFSKKFIRISIGLEGLLTLLLSVLIFISSGGLFFIFLCFKAIYLARVSQQRMDSSGFLLVLGYQLSGNSQIQLQYQQRLDTAIKNFNNDRKSTIYLLGGKMASASMSEAEAGQHYLLSKGIPANKIYLEDDSQHTLENLRNVKRLLSKYQNLDRFYLITSRYHLYRSLVFAKGLGLPVLPCASEKKLIFSWKIVVFFLFEAWILHWYYSGRYWGILTKNKAILDRIS